MSSHLLRQDFIPMVAGYLIVMAAVTLGLRATLRTGTAARRSTPGQVPAGPPGEAPAGAPPAGADRAGAAPAGADRARAAPAAAPPQWRRLAAHVAGTAVGGYLLLMLVVIGYYYGVARVGGAFIKSAFTGCALLIGLAAPVFAVASWLTERPLHPRRPRRAAPGRGPAPPES